MRLLVVLVTGLDEAHGLLARFPNLVRACQEKPIAPEFLRQIVGAFLGLDEGTDAAALTGPGAQAAPGPT